MEQYQNVVQDLAGNVVPQAVVRVLLPNGGNATVFDVNGAQMSNPVPCDAEGYFAFQAANGKYFAQVEVNNKVYKKLGPVSLYDAAEDSKRTSRVNIEDFFVAGEADATGMVQRAHSSGAERVCGNGKRYVISHLDVPEGVNSDGQGGALLTNNGAYPYQIVVSTTGDNSTIQNWKIASDTPGTRKGFYGLNVGHKNTKIRNLSFQDITYTALFNDGEGTRGTGITAQNCGWDAISNFSNAKNSTFRDVKGIGNGRSLFSTDPGAKGIVLDGFESIDNGLDVIADQHKDALHFEYATDCIIKNGVVRYTAAYGGGFIDQTWAMMRCNASKNCHFENIHFDIKSTANGRLRLGVIDKTNTDGNSGCSISNITVNSEAVSAHKLSLISFDGDARFRVIGMVSRGYVGLESRVAAANAFEHIADIDASGPGSANTTLVLSEFTTYNWTIERVKCRGYTIPYDLNGFQNSSIRDGEIEGASTVAFRLRGSGGYNPNGGALSNTTLRGTTGTVLETYGQVTRSLLMSDIKIDGGANIGLDTLGLTASVKAAWNLVGSAVTTPQTGTNGPGVLNANLNNVFS